MRWTCRSQLHLWYFRRNSCCRAIHVIVILWSSSCTWFVCCAINPIHSRIWYYTERKANGRNLKLVQIVDHILWFGEKLLRNVENVLCFILSSSDPTDTGTSVRYVEVYGQIQYQSCNNIELMMPSHGPLTRYVKFQVAHAPGMPGTFFPPPTSKGTGN